MSTKMTAVTAARARYVTARLDHEAHAKTCTRCDGVYTCRRGEDLANVMDHYALDLQDAEAAAAKPQSKYGMSAEVGVIFDSWSRLGGGRR